MYTMKQACQQTGLSYETLKFYCNQGLVPNVKRDGGNRRVFDDRDIAWINSLNCLKNCSMGIAEMQEYIALCLQGEASIPERKVILQASLSNIIRTRLSRRLIGSGCLLLIDGRQPICFV